MQTEQQTTPTKTPQVKKTSSDGKKVKKSTSKPVENEQVQSSTESDKVQEEAPLATPSVVLQSEETVVVVAQESELNGMLEFINSTSDKLAEFSKVFKDNVLSKDERNKVEAAFKKMLKSTSTLQVGYYDYLSRQVAALEKNYGSKSGGAKKVTDKDKAAIHKKLPVHPFLLSFMKLEPNTQVSRSDALSAITGYVKDEKVKNPDIMIEGDKRSFQLIGDLKPLFDGIEKIMVSKNLLEGKTMPTQIKYTQIMQYMTHCFVKAE